MLNLDPFLFMETHLDAGNWTMSDFLNSPDTNPHSWCWNNIREALAKENELLCPHRQVANMKVKAGLWTFQFADIWFRKTRTSCHQNLKFVWVWMFDRSWLTWLSLHNFYIFSNHLYDYCSVHLSVWRLLESCDDLWTADVISSTIPEKSVWGTFEILLQTDCLYFGLCFQRKWAKRDV